MRRLAIVAVLALVVGGLWWTARLIVPGPPAAPRNLVLISLDTMAPRRMGLYGGPRANTPTLERLADRGVLFRNAFSPASWTVPGTAAMLSGRYPSRIHPAGPRAHALYHLAPRLLAEYFQTAGFQTAAFTGGGAVSKGIGVDRGFDTYAEGRWSYVYMPNPVQWIRDHGRERPFFYFYHTYVVHVPYKDLRFAKDLPAGRLGGIWDRGDWDDTRKSSAKALLACCEQMEPTAEEREYLLARYDGGIARADEAVAEIWKALEEIGMQDDTMLIVTSDHGEEFWEHTGSGGRHGHSLYDEIVRVPLLWVEPGIEPGSVDVPVSLIDLVPTILARFGMAPAHVMDGRDLSPLLDGWRLPWPERPLYAETIYTDAAEGPLRWRVSTSAGTLIETPEPHYQRGKFPLPPSEVHELYLPADAGQSENVAGAAEDDLVASHADLLARFRAEAEIVGPFARWRQPPPQVLEQLRALGYLH